jgi:hypothetical protein
MEYVATYASDDRLEALRTVLREMRTSGINTSDKFIDERIAARAAKRSLPGVISLVSDDEDDDDSAQATDWTPEDFEGRDRIRVDLDAVRKSQGQSDFMKARWQDPTFREMMLVRLSDAMTANWQDSTFREKMLAANRNPETRQKISDAGKARWADDENRKEQSVRMQKMNADPKLRKLHSDITTAMWQAPGNEQRRQENSDKLMFRRDDTNPGAKKAWDAKIAAADAYVAGQKGTRVTFFRAFDILCLDPATLGVVVPEVFRHRPTLQNTPKDRIKSAFYIKSKTTGNPYFTSIEVENMGRQAGWTGTKKELRKFISDELAVWMRATAFIRREGHEIDYASVPHLAWLA